MTENYLYNGMVSLKLVGFNDGDKEKFESIFAFAESRLDVPWLLTEEVKADFYLLSHRLRSQMDQSPLLKTLPRKRCIFYATQETMSEENELIVGSENLPSLRSLVLLFNALTAKSDIETEEPSVILTPPQPAEEAQQPLSSARVIQYNPSSAKIEDSSVKSTAKDVYFDLEEGFIGLLLSKKTANYRLDLESNSIPATLYINLEEKVYYSRDQLEQLSSFFSSEHVTSKTLAGLVLHEETKELKPMPLSNLIWYAVFSCSQGRVRKGYQESDIVHLKRWPDINLPGCRDLIKLAAYMQSNATELEAVQKQTGFSMQQVYNFYNACYAIGLVKQVQKTDIFEKQLGNDRRQLFAKIGKRLNQAK